MAKITITDRFMYNLIKSYTKNDKPFFASNDYLAKELNKSISVISHSISRLLKLEYLENRGNKMCRQLYTKNDLLSADFDIKNANNSKESAENSISLEEFKREYAKNSTNKMLKTAIESAENSNILISILLSYTNKYIYSEEDLKNKKENIPFLDLVKEEDKELIKEWLSYRKQIKKPYQTERGFNSFYNKLIQLSNNNQSLKKQLIDQSINKEWQDIFPIKEEKPSSTIINKLARI